MSVTLELGPDDLRDAEAARKTLEEKYAQACLDEERVIEARREAYRALSAAMDRVVMIRHELRQRKLEDLKPGDWIP